MNVSLLQNRKYIQTYLYIFKIKTQMIIKKQKIFFLIFKIIMKY